MAELGPRTQEVLPQLSIEEKAAITAGSGFFNMTGVERLGIPNWLTTDGPNGARGSSFLGSGDSKATCIPCGSALGATWNPAQPDWPELSARQPLTLPQLQAQKRRTDAGWAVEPGRYDIVIGHSALNHASVTAIELTAS